MFRWLVLTLKQCLSFPSLSVCACMPIASVRLFVCKSAILSAFLPACLSFCLVCLSWRYMCLSFFFLSVHLVSLSRISVLSVNLSVGVFAYLLLVLTCSSCHCSLQSHKDNNGEVWSSKPFFFLSFFLHGIDKLGFLPREIRVSFLRGKAAATELRYSTYGACWVFLVYPYSSEI